MKKTLLIAIIGITFLSCSEEDARNSTLSIVNEQLESTDGTTDVSTDSSADDSIKIDTEYLANKLNPIREYVADLDKINEWPLVTDRVLQLNEIEMVASYFVVRGELTKIEIDNLNLSKPSKFSCYFRDKQLLYVHESKIEELGDDGLVKHETESYFEDGILIRSIDSQDCGAPFNQEYRDDEQERIFNDLEIIKSAYQKM